MFKRQMSGYSTVLKPLTTASSRVRTVQRRRGRRGARPAGWLRPCLFSGLLSTLWLSDTIKFSGSMRPSSDPRPLSGGAFTDTSEKPARF
jgi:hypothetical protein